MDDITRNKITEAGVNLNTALERFLGNEQLLISFLQKFSEDDNYQKFCEAMQEENYDGAFKAVHNMKGLCGNLSLEPLFETVCVEVEFLRNGENEAALEYMPELVEDYERTIAILDSL